MFHQWESEEAGMRCEEGFGGRKRRASTILDDQANGKTRTRDVAHSFLQLVHTSCQGRGRGSEKNCRKTAEEAGSSNSLGL